MPSFPIVDTHLHIWEPGRLHYPWLASVPALNRIYSIGDYRRECGTIEVAKMVFVQCECEIVQFQEEVDWVTEVARADSRICGIVAWAPLEQGEAAEEPLARLANNPLIKGIRRIIEYEPDPEFCLHPAFIRGVQMLPRYGFTFDICIKHNQLSNTLKMVRQCPNVKFILDHVAKPDIKNRQLDPWRAELRELASLPNVWCKMSGLVTEADHKAWTPADLQPYIDHVLDSFGFDRLVFGGDWPVTTLAAEYPEWVRTLDCALLGCSLDEQHKLYVRNSEAFYRI